MKELVLLLNSHKFVPFTATFIFVLGLLIGSFVNVCIYRIPIKKSIVFPPSSCTKCRHQIKWYENIPVLSWLFLRGRCSGCDQKISVIYPVIEMLNGFLYVFAFIRFGFSFELIFIFYFISAMIVTAGIDFQTQFVYSGVVLPLIVTGMIWSYLYPHAGIINSLTGAAAGGGILLLAIFLFYIVTKKIGMGLGDVYILAAIGAYSGPFKIPLILLTASLTGILFFMFAKLVFRKKKIAGNITKEDLNSSNEKDVENAIYFGPFLALAGVTVILMPPEILQNIFPF
jgi:leader peptidase (prepilin peptidase)/N-methyltransferase